MNQFIVSLIVLAGVPMTVLGSAGRPAFLGYYLGVMTMWLVFVIAASRDVATITRG